MELERSPQLIPTGQRIGLSGHNTHSQRDESGHDPQRKAAKTRRQPGAGGRAEYEGDAHSRHRQGGRHGPRQGHRARRGQRPVDLTPDEAAVYDVASALLTGGVLPGGVYKAARERFGQGGLNELVLWVGLYAQVSIILNAFDVPSEEEYPT